MAVTQDETAFVTGVAEKTGIDPRVLIAWAQQEGAYAPSGTGGHNYLNLRPYPGDPYSSVSSGNFELFSNVGDAITATVRRLEQPFARPIITAAKAGASPAQEIAAIASTGWDAGHYGGTGGPNLLATFNQLYPSQSNTAGENLSGGSNPSVFDVGANLGAGYSAIGSAVTGPINSVEKALKFLFSYRFLEIVGGLALIGIGVYALTREKSVTQVIAQVTPAAPQSSYGRTASEGTGRRRTSSYTLEADRKPERGSPGSSQLSQGDTIPF